MTPAPDYYFRVVHGEEVLHPAWSCSLAAYGLRDRMKVIASACAARPGYLAHPASGRPLADETIAQRCGASPRLYQNLLRELLLEGAIQRDPDGFIYFPEIVDQKEKNAKARDKKESQRGQLRLFSNSAGLSPPLSPTQLQSESVKQQERETAPPVLAPEPPRPRGPGWEQWAKAWLEVLRGPAPAEEHAEIVQLTRIFAEQGEEVLYLAAKLFLSDQTKTKAGKSLKLFLHKKWKSSMIAKVQHDLALKADVERRRKAEEALKLKFEQERRQKFQQERLSRGEREPVPLAIALPGLQERRETAAGVKG